MLLTISHECELGDLPDYWLEWKYFLRPDTRRVYSYLRHADSDGVSLSPKHLADRNGVSKTRLKACLRELEVSQFIDTYEDEDDGTVEITVHDVPEITSRHENVVGDVERLIKNKEEQAENVMAYWSKLFERRSGEPYTRVKRDVVIIQKLLEQHDADTVKKVMASYYMGRNDDDPNPTIVLFRKLWPELLSEWAAEQKRRVRG